ncbi:MAG TPA: pilus assembly protein [Pseudomonadales bacterium]|nr:pilus assembly protein [Pseudomonadales bacterium]
MNLQRLRSRASTHQHAHRDASPRAGTVARRHTARRATGGVRPRVPAGSARQRGVVLFLTLVILLMITMLGVSGAQVASLEERMAGGARDRDIAFQAAEAALARGEVFVAGLTDADLANFDLNQAGLYKPKTGDADDWWQTVDWSADADLPTVETAVDGVAAQPRYIVEYVRRVLAAGDSFSSSDVGAAAAAPTDIFRITAYGWGGSNRAVVMLQTTIGEVLE